MALNDSNYVTAERPRVVRELMRSAMAIVDGTGTSDQALAAAVAYTKAHRAWFERLCPGVDYDAIYGGK